MGAALKYDLADYFLDLKLGKWSFSKIGKYRGCHRAFKYQYIDKVKVREPDPKFFQKGKLLHSLLERFIFKEIMKKPEDAPELYKVIDSIKTEEILEWNGIYRTFSKSKYFTDLVEQMLEADHVHAEIAMEFNKLISGFIDLHFIHNRVLYIKDWKSGKHKPDIRIRQLALYGFWLLWYLDTDQFDKIHLEYVFVENPDDPAIGFDEPIGLDEFVEKYIVHLENFKNTIIDIKVDMECGEWERMRENCHFCPFQTHCEKEQEAEMQDLLIDLLPTNIRSK